MTTALEHDVATVAEVATLRSGLIAADTLLSDRLAGRTVTLRAVAEAYLAVHQSGRVNASKLYEAIRAFERWAGRVLTVEHLNTTILWAWLADSLRRGLSYTTGDTRREYITTLWIFASRCGLTDPSPRRVPTAEQLRAFDVPEEELRQLLAAGDAITERNMA
jgi:hypothetical protein